ncbi:Ldh family oxidoreductase [Microbacterium sp. zg.Y1090]|uniref:Ldh family oxidoreductase n=1 Tax=Microbacterium wangruii TaxID=3049073 RepID=UPI00214CE85A|nr:MULTISPECIES: Ldh family oxidoreductase [unclassified Microbacterium]MCR2817253.1 Ldh family oxidoreductase [Microbacterium sp. zg.Y1090]MDL5486079.1 Ldh family oxidoreductase [Microbacterium sp. zg-Y1211]WIM29257.1 Ldh family oxidoreductase [Microbacterium sp. zg-Y1090]
MTIDAEQLRTWTTALLQTWGYEPEDAEYLSDTLVDANLRGVDSHGVIRLPAYRARIDAGLVDPAARPSVDRNGAVVRIDAGGTAGQLAARAAVDELTQLSGEFGVAAATVRGSTHFGTAGYYARALAGRGKVAVVVSNSEPNVVPFGGKSAFLGTNPLAFAAPTGGEPLSLDMATSTTAMGKVLVARAKGQPVPPDWGVDADGAPTTDAAAVVSLLPAGGPKGYGLAFLIEVLAGVLSGAAVAGDIGNMYTDFSKRQDVGHWMLAMDVAHFLPLPLFRDRIDALIDSAHGAEPAPGFDRVLVPGEPERLTAQAREAAGIDLPAATVESLIELGVAGGVPYPGTEASS